MPKRTAAQPPPANPVRELALNHIDVPQDPDRFRPGDQAIDELAASIAEFGLLQPILVAETEKADRYSLLAGQRRYLAVTSLGHTAILARVLQLPPTSTQAVRLTENIQRLDLSPLEEAVAIKRMRDEHNLSQEDAAEQLAKGVSWVKKREALLRLQDDVMDALQFGRVNPSVALELGRIDDDHTRAHYLQSAVDYGATQDVAAAWVTNYERDGHAATPQALAASAQHYAANPGGHQLACHVCEHTFPIDQLRNVFLCPTCNKAVAGATRELAPAAHS